MAKEILTGTTLENLTAELKGTFAKKTVVQAIESKVTTLIGDDANKSVRNIANEELAAKLIPDGAKESLDTLQEIADWIQSHPDDAAAMNAAITALQTKLTLGTYDNEGTPTEYANVKAYVEAAIAALNIGNYALAADLTALAGRVKTLEDVGATKVEASATNGNIKINDVETTVYTLPDTVLHSTDIKDFTRAEIAALLADDPNPGE